MIALDKDPVAIQKGNEEPFQDPRFCIVHESFAGLKKVVQDRGWLGKINGVLLDLGVSSPQLDDPERGFSFLRDGPLDMRMNTEQALDAATWINEAKEEDICRVIREYGEERFAKRIANFIVNARKEARIETTSQLADIVKKGHPKWERRIHPATRTFQGIRIFINRELDELEQCLEQALEVMAPGGRLSVISFHSLEDRIVKRFIQKQASADEYPPDLPIRHTESNRRLKKIGGLIRPSEEETHTNPRARSARLRIAEKIK